MPLHVLAGKPAPSALWTDIPHLVSQYYVQSPDPQVDTERIAFGTSGHRGTSTERSFNEDHVAAICQAISEYRSRAGIDGPLFVGRDTHALSEPALATALEVFAANGVTIVLQSGFGYTPTPVISHAILSFNRTRRDARADGVVITPSHNPPSDGGLKYNPPSGGPADTATTRWIQDRANVLLAEGLRGIARISYARARQADSTHYQDYVMPYVRDLKSVVALDAIAKAGLKLGVDPLGGSGIAYWDPIAETYGLNIEVIRRDVDPTFRFMTVDHDGKIRMDCSSPYAMAGLIQLRDRFDIAVGNDPDYDRHGIVTRHDGLMNPNHYLAVAIAYLFRNRTAWPHKAAIGKTLVSSSMIDRVARDLGRELIEVPVGFKWFVDGLLSSRLGFGGEESAGASFLRSDGTVWSTDKDGIIMDLLAAEITATTGLDPAEHYRDLVGRFGEPTYERIDAPATKTQKAILAGLTGEMVRADRLAGELILAKLTRAPGNDAPIGGLKVVTENGWFAARPSGTEDVYKMYAESFIGIEHLRQIQQEAMDMVGAIFEKANA